MNILQIVNLKTYFDTPCGVVRAVDGVNFDIEKGKVFGIAGESGSGKTLTALSILKLVYPPGRIVEGKVLLNGIDLIGLSEKEMREIRGWKVSMVFQEPSTSFNPVLTIGEQIVEAIITHRDLDRSKAREMALEGISRVHIKDPIRIFNDYPHQLSGGTKQRAMIAMALINSPELIILDEPTTALDVTIQAQIFELLEEIIHREKLSMLFISHDLALIARMCGRVAVMRDGRIVEAGQTKEILNSPKEPYTISLLESVRALSL